MPLDVILRPGKNRKCEAVEHARCVRFFARGVMSSQEDHRQRALRYLTMAQTARDPHIANGLRLLAAAYLEMAAKPAALQQQQIQPKEEPEGPAR
jgi:hypothetical protein